MLTAGSANIRFATTAPPMHPATCAGRYAAASRQDSPPNAASTKDTTGLKWPPDTGPNIKMIANSPAAVAAAFSSNSSPVCARRVTLRGDTRADHHRGQERAAQELGQQPPPQLDRCVTHGIHLDGLQLAQSRLTQ